MRNFFDDLDQWIVRIRNAIRDQTLHAVWAGAVVAAAAAASFSGGAVGGGLAGLVLSLPRELVDQRAPGTRWPIFPIPAGKIVDMAFFIAGGALAGALVF